MSPVQRPTLYLIAGPNGAGKSTLYTYLIAPRVKAPFVNADVIEQRCKRQGKPLEDAYAAARLAAETRNQLMAASQSFVTETVFSHSSKLDLVNRAQDNGYRVELYHVHVSRPEISVNRVKVRVLEGGHDVPEEKILERFARNQALIRRAAGLADVTRVYDNSKRYTSHRWVMTLEHGRAVRAVLDLPDWVRALYADSFLNPHSS